MRKSSARWIYQPQTTWLRKAIFQLHLWAGLGIGLYVLLISLTGSVLVYRNELYRAATRDPIIVATEPGARLTDDQFKQSATRAYPGWKVLAIYRARNPNQAISISLQRGASLKNRLFHPYTGADLGDSVPLGIRLVSKLLKLHDDLLAGDTGRKINGLGALLIVVIALTGIVVWWPGIRTWRRSLALPRNVGAERFIWGLHSMLGFWTFGFILLFGVSGIYLGDPDRFQDLPDQLTYWLAYLHIGRINGIGIPCKGPGLCDQTMKLLWAVFGLAPAAMFVTGAVMWWNRVLKKRFGQR